MALDLVGERWALLVVRELLLGPKRFTDIHQALSAASPNALTERLRELAAAGVVRRRRLPPPAASWVYELTDWGSELEPILLSLGTWALRSGKTPAGDHVSADSAVLGTRAYYRHPPGAPAYTVNIVLTGDTDAHFGIQLDDHGATVARTPATTPDASLVTHPLAYVEMHGRPDRLRSSVQAGAAEVSGDAAALAQMFASTTLPNPNPAAAYG